MTTILTSLNALLESAGLDQKRTLVARHRPYEPSLRKVFPWIVSERPSLFVAYQRSQFSTLEKAMTKADHLLAFVGLEPGSAVFARAFRIGAHRTLDREAFWGIPENQELQSLGMTGMEQDRAETLWFDLEDIDLFSDAFGRLVVGWPGLERSWWRWADRNTFPVVALNETSRFEQQMPNWSEILLNWPQLTHLPRSWRDRLSQWRGVYLITDLRRKAAYVGSAYGVDNILGRWLEYGRTGHGGNKLLRQSDPGDLRFSILELTSPSLDAEAVIRLEASWKDRLFTRQIGLNEN